MQITKDKYTGLYKGVATIYGFPVGACGYTRTGVIKKLIKIATYAKR